MEDVDREISEMKLSLNARARTVAESYLTGPEGLLAKDPDAVLVGLCDVAKGPGEEVGDEVSLGWCL